MKSKLIKNIGIVFETSNLAFASSHSGKDENKDKIKKECTKLVEEIKKINDTCSIVIPNNANLTELTKIKENLEKEKKSMIEQRNALIDVCNKIIAECKKLDSKFNKTVNQNDTIPNLTNLKSELNNYLNKLTEFNKIKELLEKIINTYNVKNLGTEEENNERKEKDLVIIKLLYNYMYGFGEHTLDDDKLKKVIKAMQKGYDLDYNYIGLVFREINDNFNCSSTPEIDKFEKGVNIEDMKTYLDGGNLLGSDLVISVLKKEKLLLIAKGSDIVAGTVKGKSINNKFYKEVAKEINGITNNNFRIFSVNKAGTSKEIREKASRRSVEKKEVKESLTNSIITNYNNVKDGGFNIFNLETSIKGVELIECASVYVLNYNDGTIEVGDEVVCNGNNKNLKLSKDKMYLVVFKQDNNSDNKTTIPAAIVKYQELQINNESSDFEQPKK